jgi:hypothetical protein
MSASSASANNSITDSPWYWVYLFCTAGAIALVLAGPKFAVRQAQIEDNSQARQHAARHVAEQSLSLAENNPAPQSETRMQLWPLYVMLGIVLSVAWFNLWRRQHQRTASNNLDVARDEASA